MRTVIGKAIESPSWAADLGGLCGFTHRAFSGPPAVACRTQVHGRDVHVLRPAWATPAALPEGPAEGDGLWTDVPGLTVAVRVADCTPILLWDPERGAVAAVHAGWRGTAQDIVGAALAVGRDALGVDPTRVRAAIGPCIGVCCFEVGPEVPEGLRGAGLADPEFGLTPGPRGRDHVDLRRANRSLLVRAGVRPERVEDVGGCTVCAPGPRYESYRRDGPAAGRMRALIAPLLAALLLVVGCAGAGRPAVVDVGGTVTNAQGLLAEGRAAEAEAALRVAVRAAPDDALVRSVLARSLHAQERYLEASVQGRIALGIDPGLWQAAYNLACHSARLGRVDEALHWLQAALTVADISPEEVAEDEDLASLHDDHRFAFYLATGVLTRRVEDAVARVSPGRVEVGRPATLTVMAITLNRRLMARRETVEIELAGPLPPDGLAPVTRRETFSTGAEGGREFMQRTLHFGFRPLRPGRLALGPFRVRIGDREVLTNTAVLDVRPAEVAVHAAVGALTPPVSPGLPGHDSPLTSFFRAPSSADSGLLDALLAAGTAPTEVDAVQAAAPAAAWTRVEGREVRAFRFRAVEIDALPEALPPRPGEAQRSVFVQRGSEGWSHVLDVRPAR